MPIFEFGFEHTYVILLSTTMFLCLHVIYLLRNGWTDLVDFFSSVLVRRWYLVKKFWSLSPFLWKTGKIYLRAIFQLLYHSIKAPVCQWVSECVCLFVCSLTPPKRRTPASWEMIPLGIGKVLRLKKHPDSSNR